MNTPKTIGITGGKGGTGKSTIATALARELSKNHKVLLLDMDASCPDDHVLLNLERKLTKPATTRIPAWDESRCTKCGLCSRICLSQAIVQLPDKLPLFISENCNGCGACQMKCPHDAIYWKEKQIGYIYESKKENLDLISAETKVGELLGEEVIAQAKEYAKDLIAKNNYDYVLIDTAAGTHCEVVEALEGVDFTFVVAEPTPLGAHDFSLILELLEKLKIKSKIILNRSGMGDDNLVTKKLNKETKITKVPFSKNLMQTYAQAKEFDLPGIKEIIKILATHNS